MHHNKAFGVTIEASINALAPGQVAVTADGILKRLAMSPGATRTDMAGSAARGRYVFSAIVDESEAEAAAVLAVDLFRKAAAGTSIHVRGVGVHEIETV
ncbi:MAG TPA: hypothetical protein VHC43_14060 [Mycobacteriales bacterium]|nr:hypothetical protein [Mycobacteriales bacterium]